MREKVGKEYIVGIKINSEENDVNGITEDGFFKICLMAEKAGIDYIQVSGTRILTERIKNIVYKDIAAKLAEKVKIPVIVTGGARNVDEMNEVLKNSKIPYIGIARPLISGSDLIKKFKEGKTKKARCVLCNKCHIRNKGYATCIFNRKKNNTEKLKPAKFQSIKMGEYKITYLPDGKGYTTPSFTYLDSTDDDWKKKQY